MIGYIFIGITIAALAAVPIAFTVVIIKFLIHLKQQKLEKGEVDLIEEVKSFVSEKKEV